jgi:hypothetical protein
MAKAGLVGPASVSFNQPLQPVDSCGRSFNLQTPIYRSGIFFFTKAWELHLFPAGRF